MTPLRIRNGIDLDVLESPATPPLLSVHIRTEWLGGVQSLSTILRQTSGKVASGDRQRSFDVTIDEPRALLGNDTAPTALELAVIAVAGSFAEFFVIEASACAVEIEALTIDVEAIPADSVAAVPHSVRDLHLRCLVDSGALVSDLRAIARRARAAAPVLQLCRRAPSISVHRVSGGMSEGGAYGPEESGIRGRGRPGRGAHERTGE